MPSSRRAVLRVDEAWPHRLCRARKRLARIFRRETGLSLHRQLTRLRLRDALEHLANGKPDLTGLALDLGFSSHAHFSHSFRHEFGSTPSEFSRQLFMRNLRGMGGFFKSEHATNGDRQHDY
jgi:AraC-like DNA-binding protein